jgi:hypothetical protein
MSLVVTLENGSLFTQATGQEKIRIFAESETTFAVREIDARITFARDAAGAVTGLVLHRNGTDRPAPKVP